jgi:hypothetical protein
MKPLSKLSDHNQKKRSRWILSEARIPGTVIFEGGFSQSGGSPECIMNVIAGRSLLREVRFAISLWREDNRIGMGSIT